MEERQYNGQRKENKETNNDLQNTAHKAKDRGTRLPLNTGGELKCSRGVNSTRNIRSSYTVNMCQCIAIDLEWYIFHIIVMILMLIYICRDTITDILPCKIS